MKLRKKWNISILVIFVLLASALLGVLAMNFVQQMMKQSATVFNNYQSYYLAKWGVELGLAELSHRGIGFDHVLDSWNTLVSWNFLCAWRCDLWFILSWTSNILSQKFWEASGCQSPFVLMKGQSLLVPLFKGNAPATFADDFSSTISYTNLYGALDHVEIQSTVDQEVTFGMLVLSGEDLYSDGIFFRTGSLQNYLPSFISAFESHLSLGIPNISNEDIAPYRFYFMLSNPWDTEASFCLTTEEPLPTQQYYLKSWGKYDDQVLGLEAVYKQPIPDFLLNGYTTY